MNVVEQLFDAVPDVAYEPDGAPEEVRRPDELVDDLADLDDDAVEEHRRDPLALIKDVVRDERDERNGRRVDARERRAEGVYDSGERFVRGESQC